MTDFSTVLSQTWKWLTTADSWSGDAGIWARLGEHLMYSVVAIAIAIVVGVGLGIFIGHTGRGHNAVLATSGILRAMPTLGLLTFLALVIPAGVTIPLLPATIVLVVLAVPPILAGTASGIDGVEPAAVDAAVSMGFSTSQVISRVELPLSLPVLLGGIRSAWLQVLATATVAAYVGLGGLGRFLLDSIAVRDYAIMVGSAVLVACLALVSDVLFAVVQRRCTPAGVRVAEKQKGGAHEAK